MRRRRSRRTLFSRFFQRNRDAKPYRFYRLIQAIAVLVLAVLPVATAWDLGGARPAALWVMILALLPLALIAIPVRMLRHQVARRKATLIIPTVLLLIWCGGLLQTMRIPPVLLGIVSPGSLEAYQEWIPKSLRAEALNMKSVEGGEQDEAATTSLLNHLADANPATSISIHDTHRAMAGLSVFMVATVLTSVIFRAQWTVTFLFGFASCAGAALALVSLVWVEQSESHSESLFGGTVGPFVNPNNAAAYLNLSLAFAIGWLSYMVMKQQERNTPDASLKAQLGNWWQRVEASMQIRIRSLQVSMVFVTAACVVITMGVVSTGSRGGLLGTIAGMLAVAAFVASRYLHRKTLPILSVLCTLGVAASLVWMLPNADFTRLDNTDMDRSASVRVDHWLDSLSTAPHYFPGGSGLGTYAYAYLPFQQHGDQEWFRNADNLYLEWLVEAGLWGLPLMFGVVATFVLLLTRLEKVEQAPHVTGLVAAGWFFFASQATSQAFDFGLLMPPNLLLAALLCGCVIGYSDQISRSGRSLSSRRSTRRPISSVRTVNSRTRTFWLNNQRAFAVLSVVLIGTLVFETTDCWANLRIVGDLLSGPKLMLGGNDPVFLRIHVMSLELMQRLGGSSGSFLQVDGPVGDGNIVGENVPRPIGCRDF